MTQAGCLQLPPGLAAHQWLPLSGLCEWDPWVSFRVSGEGLPQVDAGLPALLSPLEGTSESAPRSLVHVSYRYP